MSAEYTKDQLKRCVAKILTAIGWHSSNSIPLEILSEALWNYLRDITNGVSHFTQTLGQAETNLDHVHYAFEAMAIKFDSLDDYVKMFTFCSPADVVAKYPLEKEDHLNFLKPGSQEVLTRPVHVPEHLPPMITTETLAVNGDTTENPSETEEVFKKPLDIPMCKTSIDLSNTRPPREIVSVMLTTSGFLSPAREGKLPEPRAPPPPPTPITDLVSTIELPPSPPPLSITDAINANKNCNTVNGDKDEKQSSLIKNATTNSSPAKQRKKRLTTTTTSNKKSTITTKSSSLKQQHNGFGAKAAITTTVLDSSEDSTVSTANNTVSNVNHPSLIKVKRSQSPSSIRQSDVHHNSGSSLSTSTSNGGHSIDHIHSPLKSANSTPLLPHESRINKALAAARLKTERLNTTITPITIKTAASPAASSRHLPATCSPRLPLEITLTEHGSAAAGVQDEDDDDLAVDKLNTEPDRKKANIFKKISKKLTMSSCQNDVAEHVQSSPDIPASNKLPQFPSDIVIEPIHSNNQSSPCIATSAIRTPDNRENYGYFYDDIDGNSGTPLTPKMPDVMLTVAGATPSPPYAVKPERRKRKAPAPSVTGTPSRKSKKLKMNSKPSLPMSGNELFDHVMDLDTNSNSSVEGQPKTPEAQGTTTTTTVSNHADTTTNNNNNNNTPNKIDISRHLPSQMSHLMAHHQMPSIPFPFLANYGGPGLIPTNPLFSSLPFPPLGLHNFMAARTKSLQSPSSQVNTSFATTAEAATSGSLHSASPLASSSDGGTCRQTPLETETTYLSPLTVPHSSSGGPPSLSLPTMVYPKTPSPSVRAPLLVPPSIIKLEKRNKKDKKDKSKKKAKKDKNKDKSRTKAEKRRAKEEKRRERQKKEKREKRKVRINENDNVEVAQQSPPPVKITLKIKSPSPMVDPYEPPRKLNIKPIVRPDDQKFDSEDRQVRDTSPDLAKISALVTGPPKPKSAHSVISDSNSSNSGNTTSHRHMFSKLRNKQLRKTTEDPQCTSSKYIDSDGNEVWICPACGRQDDGSPMIGCDGCDAWYHWVCVGIQVPPDDNEDWYCRHCITKKNESIQSDKQKKKRKKRDK